MAEATEGEAEHHLSPRIHSYPRDLLRQFASSSRSDESSTAAAAAEDDDDSGEIELCLGLSLNGCFGVDPREKRGGLVRSSSIASLPFLQRGPLDPAAIPALTRTCSLPVETEEEQRKRKELQSLRRLEAKRKRSEKRNNSRSAARDRVSAAAENCCDEDMMQQRRQQQEDVEDGVPARGGVKLEAEQLGPPNGVPVGSHGQHLGWAASRAAARELDGMMRSFAPMSQGSVGSQGSSSSGVSDLERRQGFDISGLGSSTESRSPSSIRSLPNLTNQKAAAIGLLTPTTGRSFNRAQSEVEDPPKKLTGGRSNGMREMQRNMIEEMPCVSTRGEGPNGRRVEGVLYKYRKGEEVRIMCVCHGSFLSPAEFVKHAGGGDVAHPLKHIVVNPTSTSFF